MDHERCQLFLKVVVIKNGVNNVVVKVESAELKDIKPGTLISYDGRYYIKSAEVEVDTEHAIKSICCDVITGEICCIDLCQRCDVLPYWFMSKLR